MTKTNFDTGSERTVIDSTFPRLTRVALAPFDNRAQIIFGAETDDQFDSSLVNVGYYKEFNGIFFPNTQYQPGAVVVFGNSIYTSKVLFTSGATFNAADWNLSGHKVGAWTPGTDYLAGDIVSNNGHIYISLADFKSPTVFETTNWTLVSSNSDAFTVNSDYLAGDIVSYLGRLYIAKVAFTSGINFDPTNWDLANELNVRNWTATTDYLTNDLVIESGRLYRALADFTSGALFDVTNWNEVSAHRGVEINDWVANTPYLTNDIVLENNRIYRANADFTSGTAFVLANWTEISSDAAIRINNWFPLTAYTVGDLVTNGPNRELYRSLNNFTSGADFVPANWEQLTLTSNANVGILWQADTVYSTGDVITESNRLYISTLDFTSGTTFDPSNWNEISSDTPTRINDWTATTIYTIGDLVINGVNRNTFRSLNDFTSGAIFNPANWQQLNIVQDSVTGRSWQADTAYSLGDVVTESGQLYNARADFTSGTIFNINNWIAPAITETGNNAAYSDEAIYVVNDVVVSRDNNRIYRTLRNIAAGSGDPSTSPSGSIFTANSTSIASVGGIDATRLIITFPVAVGIAGDTVLRVDGLRYNLAAPLTAPTTTITLDPAAPLLAGVVDTDTFEIGLITILPFWNEITDLDTINTNATNISTNVTNISTNAINIQNNSIEINRRIPIFNVANSYTTTNLVWFQIGTDWQIYIANNDITPGSGTPATNTTGWTLDSDFNSGTDADNRGAAYEDVSNYLVGDIVVSRNNNNVYRANLDAPTGTGDPSTSPTDDTFTSSGSSVSDIGGINAARTSVSLIASIGVAGNNSIRVRGVNYELAGNLIGPTNDFNLAAGVTFDPAVVVTDTFESGTLVMVPFWNFISNLNLIQTNATGIVNNANNIQINAGNIIANRTVIDNNTTEITKRIPIFSDADTYLTSNLVWFQQGVDWQIYIANNDIVAGSGNPVVNTTGWTIDSDFNTATAGGAGTTYRTTVQYPQDTVIFSATINSAFRSNALVPVDQGDPSTNPSNTPTFTVSDSSAATSIDGIRTSIIFPTAIGVAGDNNIRVLGTDYTLVNPLTAPTTTFVLTTALDSAVQTTDTFEIGNLADNPYWTFIGNLDEILINQNNIQINSTNINNIASEYLKNATVSGDTLTITRQDDTTVDFISATGTIDPLAVSQYSNVLDYVQGKDLFGSNNELYKASYPVPAGQGDPSSTPTFSPLATVETRDTDTQLTVNSGSQINLFASTGAFELLGVSYNYTNISGNTISGITPNLAATIIGETVTSTIVLDYWLQTWNFDTIATNTTAIDTNTNAIATNVTSINTNTTEINKRIPIFSDADDYAISSFVWFDNAGNWEIYISNSAITNGSGNPIINTTGWTQSSNFGSGSAIDPLSVAQYDAALTYLTNRTLLGSDKNLYTANLAVPAGQGDPETNPLDPLTNPYWTQSFNFGDIAINKNNIVANSINIATNRTNINKRIPIFLNTDAYTSGDYVWFDNTGDWQIYSANADVAPGQGNPDINTTGWAVASTFGTGSVSDPLAVSKYNSTEAYLETRVLLGSDNNLYTANSNVPAGSGDPTTNPLDPSTDPYWTQNFNFADININKNNIATNIINIDKRIPIFLGTDTYSTGNFVWFDNSGDWEIYIANIDVIAGQGNPNVNTTGWTQSSDFATGSGLDPLSVSQYDNALTYITGRTLLGSDKELYTANKDVPVAQGDPSTNPGQEFISASESPITISFDRLTITFANAIGVANDNSLRATNTAGLIFNYDLVTPLTAPTTTFVITEPLDPSITISNNFEILLNDFYWRRNFRFSDIDANRSNIAINTANITANTSNISTNSVNIQTIEDAYIKTATVAGDILTITKEDDTSINFTGGSDDLAVSQYDNSETYLANRTLLGSDKELYTAQLAVPVGLGDPETNPQAPIRGRVFSRTNDTSLIIDNGFEEDLFEQPSGQFTFSGVTYSYTGFNTGAISGITPNLPATIALNDFIISVNTTNRHPYWRQNFEFNKIATNETDISFDVSSYQSNKSYLAGKNLIGFDKHLYSANIDVPAGLGDPAINHVDSGINQERQGFIFAITEAAGGSNRVSINLPDTSIYTAGQNIFLHNIITNETWAVTVQFVSTDFIILQLTAAELVQVNAVPGSFLVSGLPTWNSDAGFGVSTDVNPYWIKDFRFEDIDTNRINHQINQDAITTNRNDIATNRTDINTIESAYLKDATVTNDILTITKQDDSTVTFEGGSDDLAVSQYDDTETYLANRTLLGSDKNLYTSNDAVPAGSGDPSTNPRNRSGTVSLVDLPLDGTNLALYLPRDEVNTVVVNVPTGTTGLVNDPVVISRGADFWNGTISEINGQSLTITVSTADRVSISNQPDGTTIIVVGGEITYWVASDGFAYSDVVGFYWTKNFNFEDIASNKTNIGFNTDELTRTVSQYDTADSYLMGRTLIGSDNEFYHANSDVPAAQGDPSTNPLDSSSNPYWTITSTASTLRDLLREYNVTTAYNAGDIVIEQAGSTYEVFRARFNFTANEYGLPFDQQTRTFTTAVTNTGITVDTITLDSVDNIINGTITINSVEHNVISINSLANTITLNEFISVTAGDVVTQTYAVWERLTVFDYADGPQFESYGHSGTAEFMNPNQDHIFNASDPEHKINTLQIPTSFGKPFHYKGEPLRQGLLVGQSHFRYVNLAVGQGQVLFLHFPITREIRLIRLKPSVFLLPEGWVYNPDQWDDVTALLLPDCTTIGRFVSNDDIPLVADGQHTIKINIPGFTTSPALIIDSVPDGDQAFVCTFNGLFDTFSTASYTADYSLAAGKPFFEQLVGTYDSAGHIISLANTIDNARITRLFDINNVLNALNVKAALSGGYVALSTTAEQDPLSLQSWQHIEMMYKNDLDFNIGIDRILDANPELVYFKAREKQILNLREGANHGCYVTRHVNQAGDDNYTTLTISYVRPDNSISFLTKFGEGKQFFDLVRPEVAFGDFTKLINDVTANTARSIRNSDEINNISNEYIKSAVITGDDLTLTNQNDVNIVYQGGRHVGSVWQPNTHYVIGDIVSESQRLYTAVYDFVTGDQFDAANWYPIEELAGAIWKADTRYHGGDVVSVSNELYIARNDFTTMDTFNPANWILVRQGSEGGSPFRPNTNYFAGELITNNLESYIARADFTSGNTFNIINWVLATGVGSGTVEQYKAFEINATIDTPNNGSYSYLSDTLISSLITLTITSADQTARTITLNNNSDTNGTLPDSGTVVINNINYAYDSIDRSTNVLSLNTSAPDVTGLTGIVTADSGWSNNHPNVNLNYNRTVDVAIGPDPSVSFTITDRGSLVPNNNDAINITIGSQTFAATINDVTITITSAIDLALRGLLVNGAIITINDVDIGRILYFTSARVIGNDTNITNWLTPITIGSTGATGARGPVGPAADLTSVTTSTVQTGSGLTSVTLTFQEANGGTVIAEPFEFAAGSGGGSGGGDTIFWEDSTGRRSINFTTIPNTSQQNQTLKIQDDTLEILSVVASNNINTTTDDYFNITGGTTPITGTPIIDVDNPLIRRNKADPSIIDIQVANGITITQTVASISSIYSLFVQLVSGIVGYSVFTQGTDLFIIQPTTTDLTRTDTTAGWELTINNDTVNNSFVSYTEGEIVVDTEDPLGNFYQADTNVFAGQERPIDQQRYTPAGFVGVAEKQLISFSGTRPNVVTRTPGSSIQYSIGLDPNAVTGNNLTFSRAQYSDNQYTDINDSARISIDLSSLAISGFGNSNPITNFVIEISNDLGATFTPMGGRAQNNTLSFSATQSSTPTVYTTFAQLEDQLINDLNSPITGWTSSYDQVNRLLTFETNTSFGIFNAAIFNSINSYTPTSMLALTGYSDSSYVGANRIAPPNFITSINNSPLLGRETIGVNSSFSFDPDVNNQLITSEVPLTDFGADLNSDQALLQIARAAVDLTNINGEVTSVNNTSKEITLTDASSFLAVGTIYFNNIAYNYTGRSGNVLSGFTEDLTPITNGVTITQQGDIESNFNIINNVIGGNTVRAVTLSLGHNNNDILQRLIINFGTGSNLTPRINAVTGTPDTTTGSPSLFTVTDNNSNSVYSFSSSAPTAIANTIDDVANEIINAINDNVEAPINFNANLVGSTAIEITASSPGEVLGFWSVLVDNQNQVTNPGNIVFNNATIIDKGNSETNKPIWNNISRNRQDYLEYLTGIWTPGRQYLAGDIVSFNGDLYIALTNNVSNVFTNSRWVQVTGAGANSQTPTYFELLLQGQKLEGDFDYTGSGTGYTWSKKYRYRFVDYYLVTTTATGIRGWNLNTTTTTAGLAVPTAQRER